MKEKIKNIIRRKTLVIPVFLAIVIALIIYGIGVQKNSSLLVYFILARKKI
jgi:hypothetical protein